MNTDFIGKSAKLEKEQFIMLNLETHIEEIELNLASFGPLNFVRFHMFTKFYGYHPYGK